MKSAERKKLLSQLSPRFSSFVPKDRLLLKAPVRDLLHAFHFEDSRFDSANFYVRAFVLPLYVPCDYLYFLCSIDIRAQTRIWNLREPSIVEDLTKTMLEQGIAFLRQFNSPLELAAKIADVTKAPENLHVMETIAYSLAVSGKWIEASDALARFLLRMERVVEEYNESTLAMKQRAELLQRLIVDNPEQALAQLNSWREQTLVKLKLTTELNSTRKP